MTGSLIFVVWTLISPFCRDHWITSLHLTIKCYTVPTMLYRYWEPLVDVKCFLMFSLPYRQLHCNNHKTKWPSHFISSSLYSQFNSKSLWNSLASYKSLTTSAALCTYLIEYYNYSITPKFLLSYQLIIFLLFVTVSAALSKHFKHSILFHRYNIFMTCNISFYRIYYYIIIMIFLHIRCITQDNNS